MLSEPFTDIDLALDVARRAGRLVLHWFGQSPEVRHKTPDQPVTDADLAADRLIREQLLLHRPNDGWLSEESAASPDRLTKRRVWVVDPIDGTRSFVAGLPEFAISIGLVEEGTPCLGVVLNPAADEVYWAVRGGPAWRSTLDGGGARRITVRAASGTPVIAASRSEIRRGAFEAAMDPAAGWRVEGVGSTALKLARVAAGAVDAYLSRGPRSEWDVCAGALILECAGGRVTDARGRALRYNGERTDVDGCAAASSGELHARLLALFVGEAASVPQPD